MIKVGDGAPDFELEADTGQKVRLSQLKGQKVVLYFYPKDMTPGCTQEACDFGDRTREFQKQGAVVLGISPDAVESHRKFKERYKLPFTLLADTGSKVSSRYGVWKKKTLYGRNFMGVERTTFVIGDGGRIAHIFPKVKVDGHVEEVLNLLSAPKAPREGAPLRA